MDTHTFTNTHTRKTVEIRPNNTSMSKSYKYTHTQKEREIYLYLLTLKEVYTETHTHRQTDTIIHTQEQIRITINKPVLSFCTQTVRSPLFSWPLFPLIQAKQSRSGHRTISMQITTRSSVRQHQSTLICRSVTLATGPCGRPR